MVLIWDADRNATREVDAQTWSGMQVFQNDSTAKTWVLYSDYLASQKTGTPIQTQTSQQLVSEEVARREGKVVDGDPGRSDRDYQAELARRESVVAQEAIVIAKPPTVIFKPFNVVEHIAEPGEPGFVPPKYGRVDPPLVSTFTPPMAVKSSPISEPIPTGQEKVSVDSYGNVFSPSQNKLVGSTGVYNPPTVESKPVIVPQPTFTEKINTSLKSVISPIITPSESFLKPQEKDSGLLLGIKQVGTGVIGSIKEDPLGMGVAVGLGIIVPELKLGQTALKAVGIASIGLAGRNIAESDKPILEAIGGEVAYFGAAGAGMKASSIIKSTIKPSESIIRSNPSQMNAPTVKLVESTPTITVKPVETFTPSQMATSKPITTKIVDMIKPIEVKSTKEPIGLYDTSVPDFSSGGKFDVKLNKIVSEKPQGLYDTTAKRYEGYSSAKGASELDQRIGEISRAGSRNPDEPYGLFSKDVPDFGGGSKTFEITIKASPDVLESLKSPSIEVRPTSKDMSPPNIIDMKPTNEFKSDNPFAGKDWNKGYTKQGSKQQGSEQITVLKEKSVIKPLEELKLSVSTSTKVNEGYTGYKSEYKSKTPSVMDIKPTVKPVKEPTELKIKQPSYKLDTLSSSLSGRNFKVIGEQTAMVSPKFRAVGKATSTSRFGDFKKPREARIDVGYDYSKVYPQDNKSKVNEMILPSSRQQNITIQKVSPREITATKTFIGLDKGLIAGQKTKERNIVMIGTKPTLRGGIKTDIKTDTLLKTIQITIPEQTTRTTTLQIPRTTTLQIPRTKTPQIPRTKTPQIPRIKTPTILRPPKLLSMGIGKKVGGGKGRKAKKFTEFTGVLLPSQMIGGSKKSKSIFKKMKVGKVRFK